MFDIISGDDEFSKIYDYLKYMIYIYFVFDFILEFVVCLDYEC